MVFFSCSCIYPGKKSVGKKKNLNNNYVHLIGWTQFSIKIYFSNFFQLFSLNPQILIFFKIKNLTKTKSSRFSACKHLNFMENGLNGKNETLQKAKQSLNPDNKMSRHELSKKHNLASRLGYQCSF